MRNPNVFCCVNDGWAAGPSESSLLSSRGRASRSQAGRHPSSLTSRPWSPSPPQLGLGGRGGKLGVVVAAAAAAACSSSAFVSDAHFSSGFPFSNGGWRLGFPPSLPIQGNLIDLRGRGMMFGDMAFEGQGLTTTTASYNHHHMLSFMGSSPDPTLVPRATTGDVLPPPPSPSPLPKYKFVTASPANWSAQELATLNEGLLRYAHEPSITKYIKIAAMLPAKTIRDVAIRCCWIPGKESRRRKPDDYYSGNLKNKMAASTSVANIPRPPPNNVNLFSLSLHHPSQNRLVPMEVPVLDSATQNLLEENNQLLRQIASNIETFKAEENMDLILHTNSNIRAISESEILHGSCLSE